MNIWTILGVKPTAGTADIKKAYARLAAECHIERDPKGFQKLHEAYVEAMEIAKGREKNNPQKAKEEPESKPAVFRATPKNLHKLGPAGPVNEEESSVQGESGQPEAGAYQFRPPEGAGAKPEEAENQNKGYSFPKGGAAGMPTPENMPQQAGEYHFPKGGAVAPPPENEDRSAAPVYAFPRPVDKPGSPLPFQGASHQDPPKQEAAYSFPKGGAANMLAPENTPQQTGEYQFPKGGAVAPSPQEEAKKNPAYVFSASNAKPDADKPPEDETADRKHPKHIGEYQFPQSSPRATPASGQSTPFRGNPAASPGAIIFPGIIPLEDMDIPIMPLPLDSSEEYFPQTKEEAELLTLLENARNRCLEDMQTLLEENAPERAWYPILLGADFTLVQHNGKVLLKLQNLCLKRLSLEMASALYTAYGFASEKSLRKYPAATTLHAVLNQFRHLPQDAIPFLSLSDTLHRCDMALTGMARLCAACSEPYVCDQALRAPAFIHVKHQPYFIHRLTEFLEKNGAPEEWRQALAQAYRFTETQISPSLLALAKQLPQVAAAKKPVDYNSAADNLFQSEAALSAFFATARENVLDLLEKTRKAFPRSTRRVPWEYVFTHPEFRLVRRDWEFLTGLLSFLRKNSLPVGIWPALEEAYAAEFAHNTPKAAGDIPEPGPDTPPEERATRYLLLLRDMVANHEEKPKDNPSFLEIVKSMLASI